MSSNLRSKGNLFGSALTVKTKAHRGASSQLGGACFFLATALLNTKGELKSEALPGKWFLFRCYASAYESWKKLLTPSLVSAQAVAF
jgi:hypothetical protein